MKHRPHSCGRAFREFVKEERMDKNGNRMLGVAFEKTDEMTRKIEYGGCPYVVSYKTAIGIEASMKPLFTSNKTNVLMNYGGFYEES
jgi:hypothetical protein